MKLVNVFGLKLIIIIINDIANLQGEIQVPLTFQKTSTAENTAKCSPNSNLK